MTDEKPSRFPAPLLPPHDDASHPAPEGTDSDSKVLVGIWNGLIAAVLKAESVKRRDALLGICKDMLRLPDQQMELVWGYEKLVILISHKPGTDALMLELENARSDLISQEILIRSLKSSRERKPLWARVISSIKMLLGWTFDGLSKAESDYLEKAGIVASLEAKLSDEDSAYSIARKAALEDVRLMQVRGMRFPWFDHEAYADLIRRALDKQERSHDEPKTDAPGTGKPSSIDDLLARMKADESIVDIPPLPVPGMDIIETRDPLDRDGGIMRILYSARRASTAPPDLGCGISFAEYVSQVIGTPSDSAVLPKPLYRGDSDTNEDFLELKDGDFADSSPPSSGRAIREAILEAITRSSYPPSQKDDRPVLSEEDIIRTGKPPCSAVPFNAESEASHDGLDGPKSESSRPPRSNGKSHPAHSGEFDLSFRSKAGKPMPSSSPPPILPAPARR